MNTPNSSLHSKVSSPKNDLNFNRSSILYFQIGLILGLLAVYVALEYAIRIPAIPQDNFAEVKKDNFEVAPEPFKVEKEIVISLPENPKPKSQNVAKLTPNLKTIDDDSGIETKILSQPQNSGAELNPDDINVVMPPEDMPIIMVEKVPVFPGCEHLKTNEEQRQCLSDKIQKIIQKNFNTGLAQDYGLKGKQLIAVQFKIDSNGEIVEIKTRAPHPALEKETVRVLGKIPTITPGKHNGKPVNVKYALPIRFVIN